MSDVQDQIDYLVGQVEALTKFCMTLFAASQNIDVISPFLETLEGDLRNPSLPADHIRGIETVISQFRAVLQIRESAVKKVPSKDRKGH